MGYIYKITNLVNNKMYIGKTESSDPFQRWKEHLNDYNKNRNEKRPLYEAMTKYGINNFTFEVIEKTENTSEKEIYYINLFRTYIGFKDCNGYNATLGGDGKSYLSLNEQDIINFHITSGYRLGITAKHFNVDSSTIKNILKKNNIKWLNPKEIKRYNMQLKNGGIVQLDKDTKNIINVFNTLTEANEYLGKNKGNGTIYDACYRRKTHFAFGFLWYFGKDYFGVSQQE